MNPLLLEIPEEFETERLLIRVARAGDGPSINEAICETSELLRLWMPWAQTIPSVEESELHARKSHANFVSREELPLRLFLRDTGQFVGGSGLHRIDWSVPRGEIGYWIRASLQGQGLMTEAVVGITEFGFSLGMERIEIRCDPRNAKSAAVAERAGFTLEGTLRSDSRTPQGELRDSRVYSRIARE